MRTKALYVAAALAALAIPAAVFAATPQQLFLGGLADYDDSTVRMKTGGSGDNHRVKVFAAKDFPIDCEGEEGTIRRASIRGGVPIGTRGRFHGRDDNGETELNVRGEVDGRNAEGVFRFSGEIEDEDGDTQECDTGRLDWSAHAPAT
jgi:hypothetical protein